MENRLGFPTWISTDIPLPTQMASSGGGLSRAFQYLNDSEFKRDSLLKPLRVNSIRYSWVKTNILLTRDLLKMQIHYGLTTKTRFYLKGSFKELNSDQQKGMEWESLSAINLPIDLSLPHDRNYLRFHFGDFLPQIRRSITSIGIF